MVVTTGGCTTGIQRGEPRVAAKHPTMHRAASGHRELPGLVSVVLRVRGSALNWH